MRGGIEAAVLGDGAYGGCGLPEQVASAREPQPEVELSGRGAELLGEQPLDLAR